MFNFSLPLLMFLPIIFVFGFFFIPNHHISFIKFYALSGSIILFYISLWIWIRFHNLISFFQFYSAHVWFYFFNIHYIVGVDGVSLFFIVLSTFLIPFCILISWTSIFFRVKEYFILFFVIEWLLLNVFSVLDLLLFYIFFEAILIPMFLIIGIWGSRPERVGASFQFFFYTLVGSLFMLLGILLIFSLTGGLDSFLLLNYKFSNVRQLFLWLSFFASFAVKIPMFPFHIWLPQAHVEAPTAGSVILAGILLKLGGYGFIRYSLPLFPFGSEFFAPLVFILSVIAILYTSLTTIRQIDLKRIIAYSSVSHMNYVTLGIFSFSLYGLEGSILLMLSHGFISSTLFLCIGMLYDRFKTRILRYFQGLTQLMPLFSILFLFLTFANISFPGTSGFIGEMLVLLGLFDVNKLIAILATFGTILGTVYSIWLYNRVFFGNLNLSMLFSFSDMNRREFFIIVPFVVLILLMGIYPLIFFNSIHSSISSVFFYNSMAKFIL